MNITKKLVMEQSITFDDVQLLPQYSELVSRSHCDTKTQITRNYTLDIPLIAAPMASICDGKMANIMMNLGGIGIIHRFNTVEEQLNEVAKVFKLHVIQKGPCSKPLPFPLVAAAVGAKPEDLYRAQELVWASVRIILIDVAHGHHSSVRRMINDLREWREQKNVEFDIVAGNIATKEAAIDLYDWGADALRVGIGGGSVCETRIRTGVGVPQISSIMDVVDADIDIPIISCGGVRYPGDVAKAIAAGADTVILGSMLAGTDETPGETMYFGPVGHRIKQKLYHGSASDVQKILSDSILDNIEGTAAMIAVKGPTELVINEILDGLRSSMSYVGATNLSEFYSHSNFIRVTTNGLKEAHPHLI